MSGWRDREPTQRERLAALLGELKLSDGYMESDIEVADALLARDVRVVDERSQAERLADVLTEVAGYVSTARHGRPERTEYRLWLPGALANIDRLIERGVRVVDLDADAAEIGS